MAKKIAGIIKLQIPAGKATPAPPVGPALGQHGVNIMEFTKAFNERTANQAGMIIPVVITVYEDRSFTFITKTPPVPVLIKKAINLEKGFGGSQQRKSRYDYCRTRFARSPNLKWWTSMRPASKRPCEWSKVLRVVWELSCKSKSFPPGVGGWRAAEESV